MSINRKNRNKEIHRKNKGVNLYTFHIRQLLVIIDYQAGYQIKAKTKKFNPMIRYANDLI